MKNENENPWQPNDSMSVFVNQAERDAYVLAVIGDDILIEYEMPAGTSALVQYAVVEGKVSWPSRNYSYNAVPKRWLKPIRDANMTNWIGMGQRSHIRIPFPAA